MTISQTNNRKVIRINYPKPWGRLREYLEGAKLSGAKAPLLGHAMEEIYADPSEDNPLLTKECVYATF